MKNLGNDPFDYEKKFAEDKRGEELASAARVWRTYLEECAASDGEMVEGWRDGLDVLLVFVSTIRPGIENPFIDRREGWSFLSSCLNICRSDVTKSPG